MWFFAEEVGINGMINTFFEVSSPLPSTTSGHLVELEFGKRYPILIQAGGRLVVITESKLNRIDRSRRMVDIEIPGKCSCQWKQNHECD